MVGYLLMQVYRKLYMVLMAYILIFRMEKKCIHTNYMYTNNTCIGNSKQMIKLYDCAICTHHAAYAINKGR